MRNGKIDGVIEITEQDLGSMINDDRRNVSNENIKIKYSIKNRLEKAKEEPKMKRLFGNYLLDSEICILAGDTGIGKTVLAFQIADSITKGISILEQENELQEKVLYYDFELSNRNLLRRYQNHDFSDYFFCPDIDDILLQNEGIFNFENINEGILETGAKVIIIDNITALTMKSTQDQDTAMNLMKNLKQINKNMHVTFLILAHTPKIPGNIPLNINHIAGSKHLTNFADNVLLLGRSSQGIERRYLKQVKNRNTESIEQVLVMDINSNKYLKFEYVNYDDEKNHLDVDPDKQERKRAELIDIAKNVFGAKALRYKEFCNEYSKQYHKSPEMGKKILKQMNEYNLIVKNAEGKWIINGNEI